MDSPHARISPAQSPVTMPTPAAAWSEQRPWDPKKAVRKGTQADRHGKEQKALEGSAQEDRQGGEGVSASVSGASLDKDSKLQSVSSYGPTQGCLALTSGRPSLSKSHVCVHISHVT